MRMMAVTPQARAGAAAAAAATTSMAVASGSATAVAPPLPPLDASSLRRSLEVSLDAWARSAGEAAEGVTSGRAVVLDAARDVLVQLLAALSVAWRPDATKHRPKPSALSAAASVGLYALACGRPPALAVVAWIVATYAAGSFLIFLLFRLLESPNSLTVVMHVIALSLVTLTVLEPLMTLLEGPLPILGYIVKTISVLWAARTASVFLITTNTSSKAFLFAYPCVLLHVYMLNLRR